MRLNKMIYMLIGFFMLQACSGGTKEYDLPSSEIYLTKSIILDTLLVAKFEDDILIDFLSDGTYNSDKLIHRDSVIEIHLYPRLYELETDDYDSLDVVILNNSVYPVISIENISERRTMKLQTGGGCILIFKKEKLVDFTLLQ